MGSITLLYPYYEHREMFRWHFEQWNAWPDHVKKEFEIIVIDDGSEKYPFDAREYEVHCPIRVFRIKENILWNVAGVKNLGFRLSRNKWVLAADADLMLEGEDAAKLLKLDFSNRYRIYWPTRRRISGPNMIERREPPHCNSFLMNKWLFWDAGGFDEDFSGGWGSEDTHFHQFALRKYPIENVVLDEVFLSSRRQAHGATPTLKTKREGANRNKHILYDKLVAEEHSGNPIRFEWEQIV